MYDCESVPRDDSCRVTKVSRSYYLTTVVSRMYLGSLFGRVNQQTSFKFVGRPRCVTDQLVRAR